MDYIESSESADVRSAMQYEHLIKEIDIVRPEGLELTLKDSSVPIAAPREIRQNASTTYNGAKNKTSQHVRQPKAAAAASLAKSKVVTKPAPVDGNKEVVVADVDAKNMKVSKEIRKNIRNLRLFGVF